MQSNITDQQYFNDDLPLSEPHFDEEATLLSARPVVPLREIKAEGRSGKRLVFGVAMLGSLTVGVLGATLIYKRQGQEQATAIVSTAVPGSGVIGPVSAPPTTEIVGGVAAETVQDAATVEKKGTLSVFHSESSKVGVRKSLVERVEAQRRRSSSEREAQKDSGGRKRKASDELLRIRDIFEGPSRP
ncbi:MAG: hypothetical protein ABJA18_03300 [bacterium]